jgi:imidazolonepropionase-like amidohydrolase
MNRRAPAIRTLLVVSALTCAVSPPTLSQTADAVLVVRAGTIYPAPDLPPVRDGIVMIRNGKIAYVGLAYGIKPPADATVLDMRGLTIVAGFWNSHVHFTGQQWAGADKAASASLTDSFQQMLTRWGFTTVFDTGSSLKNTLALRRRVASGDVDGPRIFTTGDILFPPGADRESPPAGTPAEAAASATTLLDGGADGLKVYAQAFWDLKLKLPLDVLTAVCTEAHRRGVPVFAHPSNRDGLYNSVSAGVDVLVHTTPQIGPWGSELVERMKAANIALIPTLKLWRFELLKDKLPAARIEEFQRRGVDQLREYFSAKGPIMFGTDVGYMTDFSTLEELQKMAEAGMGFRDILGSLTTVPAARRGLENSVGRIAVGFDGDLVALRTDPARSVNAFADVAYTIRGGRTIYRAAASR